MKTPIKQTKLSFTFDESDMALIETIRAKLSIDLGAQTNVAIIRRALRVLAKGLK